jgi:hypothetical protein
MTTPDPNPIERRPPPPPSSSVGAPRSVPQTRIARDFAAEEELNRRLMSIMIQIRRAQFREAEGEIADILTEHPNNAAALELQGDIRQSVGNFLGAKESWREALQKEPGRATAEMKLARAALEQAETQRQARLGALYSASGISTQRAANTSGKKTSVVMAVLGSAIIPGLGQRMNGQYAKAAIFFASYFVGGLLLLMTGVSDMKSLLPQMPSLTGANGGNVNIPSVHAVLSPSPISWLLIVLTTVIWLYSMVDAGLAARSHASPPPEKSKSNGWEV